MINRLRNDPQFFLLRPRINYILTIINSFGDCIFLFYFFFVYLFIYLSNMSFWSLSKTASIIITLSVRLRASLARILSFDFKILYLAKIMIKRQQRRKERKRVIPLWNLIWNVFLKGTVEETKLKERYTVSSIWKKSFRDLYYQFQFQFQSVLFQLRLKFSDLKREMRTLLKQF